MLSSATIRRHLLVPKLRVLAASLALGLCSLGSSALASSSGAASSSTDTTESVNLDEELLAQLEAEASAEEQAPVEPLEAEASAEAQAPVEPLEATTVEPGDDPQEAPSRPTITVKTDDTTEPTPLPGDPPGTDVAAA